MELHEYYNRALIFERPGMKPLERRIHAALGLGSELLEFDAAEMSGDNVNLMEEQGDLMWFAALAVDASGDLTLQPGGIDKLDVVCLIGEFITEVKREFVYEKADIDRTNLLANQIFYTLAHKIAAGQGADYLVRVLKGNIAKLYQRYKSGRFTISEAIHRLTLSEIEAMMKAS